ncbi:MAG: HAD hydrolase-like protein, partial [Okeania sp. SIO2D1]|nr:HAD hydrolase-like protein [Okeania sp. SIO2D1]
MLEYAIQTHDVDTSQILFVGDRPEDQQAAEAAGIKFFPAEVSLSDRTKLAMTLDADMY